MKIGFSTFACPDWTFDQIVDAAVRSRYDGVEFRCDADQEHYVEVFSPGDERAEKRAKLADHDLETCCVATSLQVTREDFLQQLPPRLDLARDMGALGVRVFCGPMADWMRSADLADYLTMQLRHASHLADDAGMELWLETHDTLSRAADCAAILRQVDHPSINLAYNTLHPCRKGEPVDATIAAISGLVRHVYFTDGLGHRDKVVVTRLDKGDLPMDDIFRSLVNMGYDGYLVGQWFHDEYGDSPQTSLDAYREGLVDLAFRNGVTLR